MEQKNNQSRRNFIKSTALATTAIAGGALSGCNNSGHGHSHAREEKFPLYRGSGYQPEDGVAGLLFSQVGYELGHPVKVMVRLPGKDLSDQATCRLTPAVHEKEYQANFRYWGSLWKSHWWIAAFEDIHEKGEWDIEVEDGGDVIFQDRGLKVAENILWDKTIEYASVDMLERRKHFTKVGAGWQDAGTLWVESPAQSAMIIALTELLEKAPERFDQDFKDRIYTQLTIGCDYLVMTQEPCLMICSDMKMIFYPMMPPKRWWHYIDPSICYPMNTVRRKISIKKLQILPLTG